MGEMDRLGWMVGLGSLPRDSIRIAQRTSVEVVRDAFPGRGVFEGSAFARDGEK